MRQTHSSIWGAAGKTVIAGICSLALVVGAPSIAFAEDEATPSGEYLESDHSSHEPEGLSPLNEADESQLGDGGPVDNVEDAVEGSGATQSTVELPTAAATAASTLEIRADELCVTSTGARSGFISFAGGVSTVNLAHAGAGITELVIDQQQNAYSPRTCLSDLTSIVMTNPVSSTVNRVKFEDAALGMQTQNLSSVTFPGNLETLEIGRNAFNGHPKLTSVSFGPNVRVLDIGNWAFEQGGGSANTWLESVSFPTGLRSLTIGDHAFDQSTSGIGSTTLSTVTFPAGLENLTVGFRAFEQRALGSGRTSLRALHIPDGVKTLFIDDYAFMQTAWASPQHNALQTVSLPGGMTSVRIDNQAFSKRHDSYWNYTPAEHQAQLHWRTAQAPATGPHSITLARVITGDSRSWYWDGADNTGLAQAWAPQLSTSDFLWQGDYILNNAERVSWPVASRLAGGDRFTTAVEISQSEFSAGSVDTVVLATGYGFADALSAAPLAAKLGGPLLLTQQDVLNRDTEAELRRLAPSRVIIVGGAPAVGPAVASKLETLGYEVVRLAGNDRFETSLAIAQFEDGWKNSGATEVFLATGLNFPDALAAGAAAAGAEMPVILVNGGANTLSQSQLDALGDFGTIKAYIAGAAVTVSNGIAQHLERRGIDTQRFAGADRVATSALIAEHFGLVGNRVYVAQGWNFPDALAGAAVAGRQKAALVLSQQNCFSNGLVPVMSTLEPSAVVLLGGIPALSVATEKYQAC